MAYLGSRRHIQNCLLAASKGAEATRQARIQRQRDYAKDPVPCVQCDKALDYGKHTTNTFCSRKCAAAYNLARRDCSHAPQTREKIAQALLERSIQAGKVAMVDGKPMYVRTCAVCEVQFHSPKRRTRTCGHQCKLVLRERSCDHAARRENGRRTIQRLMAENRWKGWNGRGDPSYPETYVASLLEQHGIDGYLREHKVGRFSIDFAFPDAGIALEVDGKQHDYPANRARDARRDKFLESQGWMVVRMKWRSVRTAPGLESVSSQFQAFAKLLGALRE